MSVCHTQSSQDTLPLLSVVGGDFFQNCNESTQTHSVVDNSDAIAI